MLHPSAVENALESYLGALQSVAVKVLKAGRLDEDGDPIDMGAEEEFAQECAMLQRVSNHPFLLKFYGFGVNTDGTGFIVTELLEKGSLRGLLADTSCELPWRTRVTIAHQLAQGMEHLHSVPIVHRGTCLLHTHTRFTRRAGNHFFPCLSYVPTTL